MGEPVQRRITALIPFYAQQGGAYGSGRAYSPEKKRADYLTQTMLSLPEQVSQIVVGVCNSPDFDTVSKMKHMFPKLNIVTITTKRPEWLIVDLCKYTQNFIETDYVLYTDSDHVFHIVDFGKLVSKVKKRTYIVPHRLEELYLEYGSNRGPIVEYKKKRYVLCNAVLGHAEYVHPLDQISGYGAAYLCTKELFDRVNFRYENELPGEQGAGFNIFNTEGAECLKTGEITDFFVDHLSGYEYHKSLAGVKT
jgi:hypothetical protein